MTIPQTQLSTGCEAQKWRLAGAAVHAAYGVGRTRDQRLLETGNEIGGPVLPFFFRTTENDIDRLEDPGVQTPCW